MASVISSKHSANKRRSDQLRRSSTFQNPSISADSIPITSIPNDLQRAPLFGYIIFLATDQQKKRTILFGSPANKAGLQVGDHIVEVNGCSTEGKDHAQIVALIHQKFLLNDLSLYKITEPIKLFIQKRYTEREDYRNAFHFV
uniref:PDZ domain-containing protein n=1 Tax=Setaria digitata TaxID=48799 RepID=A0A915Q8A2_9BILA